MYPGENCVAVVGGARGRWGRTGNLDDDGLCSRFGTWEGTGADAMRFLFGGFCGAIVYVLRPS